MFKVVQSLTSYKGATVTKLKWSSVNFAYVNKEENDLVTKLASASDDSNFILIWNANDGKVVQELHEINNFQALKINGK